MPTKVPEKVSAAESGKKPHKAEPKHKKVKDGHPAVLGFTVFFAVIIVVLASLCVAAGNYKGIYPNTYIAECKVSDMSEAEISDYLAQTYTPEKLNGKSFKLICEDSTLEVPAAELNISFDNDETLRRAVTSGKDGNVIQKAFAFASRLFGKEVISPIVTFDEDKLAAAFNEVAASHETEPVGHTFTINADSVTIIGPVNGLKANRDTAMNEAEAQLCAMQPGEVVLKPERVVPDKLDPDVFYNWLTSDAEDAYYEKAEDGKVVVHDGKPKCTVGREEVDAALKNLETAPDNTVTVPVTVTQPENTGEKLKAELYSESLGKYSTNYGASSAARANNVRLATSRINGVELMPGEEFSYDKTILPRTSANGYMAAPVYVGNKVESGLGGGICQPSSTLYAAALYANLEILERHNHSLPVSYIPPGMDATIAQGVLDLRLRNSTGYPIKINASADGGVLTFEILGYNPEKISVELERYTSGGAYCLNRIVKRNGEVINKEKMTSSVYGTPEKGSAH